MKSDLEEAVNTKLCSFLAYFSQYSYGFENWFSHDLCIKLCRSKNINCIYLGQPLPELLYCTPSVPRWTVNKNYIIKYFRMVSISRRYQHMQKKLLCSFSKLFALFLG